MYSGVPGLRSLQRFYSFLCFCFSRQLLRFSRIGCMSGMQKVVLGSYMDKES